ncbi:peptide chain release factor N(5)-glutamine methyltransferase [Shimia sp. FJ5]|uniref:peptide chain release factor N(5)-glutamine methyltransferase n=1 Tax=Shimia sp. FJ5 TaxID=3079054 RepID=UPI00262C9278|nr:peptide chain release factor N(5)-glutamine methyltransferase [Shimia sp. FJ5]MDV4145714.1 peptide chain release factor N(5)-glutamine methyltransferase [Shimia sp. FJ5]
MTTLRDALAEGVRRLLEAGIAGAPRDARALLAAASHIAPDRVLLEGDMVLSDPNLFDEMIARRVKGEPVAKIIGERLFWGRSFKITRDTLDPRPETETLIAAALETGPVERFVDLGTGSGIIVVTLLAEWPETHAVATDVSPEAIAVAQENAARHGVLDRLRFVQLSSKDCWFPESLAPCDLILSNPPYISEDEMAELSREVLEHDPHIALSPGGDGMDPYRKIASSAWSYLRPDGRVLVEIGWQQGDAVTEIFQKAGFRTVSCLPDMDGRDRVIVAEGA